MSHAIRVTRVACIFFMMFTHVRPYPEFEHFPRLAYNIVLHLFYAVPSLLIGKASVPLLGAISGWLFVQSYRGGWADNAKKKLRSVLLPLLLWNGLVLLLLWAIPSLETRWIRPDDIAGWIDKFVPLVDYPTNSPLYFLRDLFLCTLAAPLLLAAFDRWGAQAMAAAMVGAILFASVFVDGFLLTRPVILPTFLAGLILARTRAPVLERRFFDTRLLWVATAWTMVALCVTVPLLGTRFAWLPELGALPEVVTRFALAFLMWRAIVQLANMPAGRVAARLEPYIFFVFCTHHIVQLFSWYLFGGMISNGAYSPVYPLYFFAEPVMAMLVGIAGYRLLARVAPKALGVLTGGRIAPETTGRRWVFAGAADGR